MAITRPTFTNDSGNRTSGTPLNAAFFTSLIDGIDLTWLTDSYVPAITSTGTNPTTSATTGAYHRAGKRIAFLASFTLATVGTGNYIVSMPVASVAFPGNIKVFAIDTSAGSAIYHGHAYISTSTTALLVTTANPATNFTPTVPFTFAAGDIIHVFGTYFAS